MTEQPHDITLLLERWRAGDQEALEELLPIVYNELQKIARGFLIKERRGHTLRANDLVHEAYLRLVNQEQVDWQSRAHFYALAATFMRRILLDHARRRLAKKREAELGKVTLNTGISPAADVDLTYLVDVNEAIDRLAKQHPRQARVVELKIFVELTIEEIAEALDVAPATVKRDWAAAQEYLRASLQAS